MELLKLSLVMLLAGCGFGISADGRYACGPGASCPPGLACANDNVCRKIVDGGTLDPSTDAATASHLSDGEGAMSTDAAAGDDLGGLAHPPDMVAVGHDMAVPAHDLGMAAPDMTMSCMPRTCGEQQVQCGVALDGCGSTISCGDCHGGKMCGVGGPNVCGKPGMCKPLTCADLQAHCGLVSDSCANVLNCGSCPSGQSCGKSVANQCG